MIENDRSIRVLLIGPLPPPMGGTSRHFATLVDDLNSRRGYQITVVSTSRGVEPSLLRNLLTALKALFCVLANLRRVDIVSYHASNRGMFLFGPLIVALCKLANKRTVLRIFGGSFGDFYQDKSRIGKAIIKDWILSSDIILIQTRRAIHQLEGLVAGRLEWFSTYIKTSVPPPIYDDEQNKKNRASCASFVFLGHLWRVKGVETILGSAKHLPEGVSIDIYGPLDEYTAEDIRERGMGRVRYCGVLSHDEVDAKLWEYDCLVLPTFHSSEGYPGVIAEAYAHELPVITTRWLAIPEIVDEDCGILIDPEDTEAFIDAIRSLNSDRDRWLRLKRGARARAGQFDHALWAKKFEDICEQLVNK